MDPVEIKAALGREGLRQSDIARACKVTHGHVYRVIQGISASHPVQTVIAAAINRPVEEVFPKRYAAKKDPAKLRELERVNEQVRMAS